MYTPGKQYNLHELLQKADDGDLEAMETAVMLLRAEGYTEWMLLNQDAGLF